MKTFSLRLTLTAALLSFTFSLPSFASQFVGTVLIAKGDVKVLTQALPTATKTNKYVLYEGKKFSYRKGKIGIRLKPGQVVQTGTDGRAKVAYSNGDHIILAPGSSVSMPEPVKGKKGSSQIQLFYGKIRALVSKKGPRKKMKAKTKSAVAGVRGTDFYLSYSGGAGTELTVLRGAVEIDNSNSSENKTKETKTKLVKTGFSAKVVETNSKAKKPSRIEVTEAPKNKLIEIQAASHVKFDKQELKTLPKEQQKSVRSLQKKALEVVLDDVKSEDPELYKKLIAKKSIDESTINTEVVSKLYKQAPAPKKPKKANLDEIDQIGQDVYEKYFKD